MKKVESAIAREGGLIWVDPVALSDFQGPLKDLSRENYEKLKNRILKLKFSFVIHAWPSQEKLFILDGHQRIRALLRMREEGIEVPEVPVVKVEAESFKQAREKVLAGTSQFGQITGEGLYEFIAESGLDWREVIEENRFSEIDTTNFVEQFYGEQAEPDLAQGVEQQHIFEVVVSCKCEKEQEQVYNHLTEQGLSCRVLSM